MAELSGVILVCSLVVTSNLDLCTSENALEVFRVDETFQSEQACQDRMRRLVPGLQTMITSEDRIRIVCTQKGD